VLNTAYGKDKGKIYVEEVEETKGVSLTELAELQEEIWNHRYPDGS
jgi:hypothetical protein